MIAALFMMGGLGLIVGVGLAAASKIFYVYVDPLIVEIDDALPGANCGGCGLPGCSANAEAIVAGKAAPNSCVAAGPEVDRHLEERTAAPFQYDEIDQVPTEVRVAGKLEPIPERRLVDAGDPAADGSGQLRPA